MKGRRRPDTVRGLLPRNIRAGDYWKVLEKNGSPANVEHPTNLTGTEWYVVSPTMKGYGIGRLIHHTVREEDDGTISVRPGDGSSNSILIRGANGQQYHGFIEHGVWS